MEYFYRVYVEDGSFRLGVGDTVVSHVPLVEAQRVALLAGDKARISRSHWNMACSICGESATRHVWEEQWACNDDEHCAAAYVAAMAVRAAPRTPATQPVCYQCRYHDCAGGYCMNCGAIQP